MIALFDSTITFHALFQQSHDLVALLDLLVMDRDNPRSLAWVAHTLRGRLAKLSGAAPTELGGLAPNVPDPSQWKLAELCTQTEPTVTLDELLKVCVVASYKVSDDISMIYFTHSSPSVQTS